MKKILFILILVMLQCQKENSQDVTVPILFLLGSGNKQSTNISTPVPSYYSTLLSGKLVDKNNKPISKASVLFAEQTKGRASSSGTSVLTNSQGTYSITLKVPPAGGNYNVTISKYGITLGSYQVSISKDPNSGTMKAGSVANTGNTVNPPTLATTVNSSNPETETTTPIASTSSSQKAWTYMVYMGADNNLSPSGLEDILEMETVGTNSNINIVVQAEFSPVHSPGIDTNTKRFLVQKQAVASIPKSFQNGTSIGNVDMGNKSTLTDFIKWATTNYPANNYMLVIWDHGDGWKSRQLKNTSVTYRGAVADDTSGSYMSTKDIAQAVKDAGVKLNIINFDTCLMAMYEVAYEFKGLTDYMVFSEETEPGWGDPYDTILSSITSSTTAKDLATIIPTKFQNFYTQGTRETTTKSAVDMSKLDDLHTSIQNLSKALKTDTSKIITAISSSQKFTAESHHDLYNFAEKIILNYPSNTSINSAATSVKNAINNFVLAHKYTQSTMSNSHGLAIYIPQLTETNQEEFTKYKSLFSNSNIADSWSSLVEAYLGGSSGSLQYSDKGAFGVYITWDTDADLDLMINEPNGNWYAPYSASSSPNATLSTESSISGVSEEYYIGNDLMEVGYYDIIVSYYKNGATSNYANVTIYYVDPANGVYDWTQLDGTPFRMDLSNPENGACNSKPTFSEWSKCLNLYSNYGYPGYLKRYSRSKIIFNTPSRPVYVPAPKRSTGTKTLPTFQK